MWGQYEKADPQRHHAANEASRDALCMGTMLMPNHWGSYSINNMQHPEMCGRLSKTGIALYTVLTCCMQHSQVPYSAIEPQAASFKIEQNTSRLRLKPHSRMHDEM